MSILNAVVFILIKYLADWAGPQLGPLLESVASQLLSGGLSGPTQNSEPSSDGPPQSRSGLPDPPESGGSSMGGLDLGSLITSVGTMFTQGMGGGGGARAQPQASSSQAPRPEGVRRPRYNE